MKGFWNLRFSLLPFFFSVVLLCFDFFFSIYFIHLPISPCIYSSIFSFVHPFIHFLRRRSHHDRPQSVSQSRIIIRKKQMPIPHTHAISGKFCGRFTTYVVLRRKSYFAEGSFFLFFSNAVFHSSDECCFHFRLIEFIHWKRQR